MNGNTETVKILLEHGAKNKINHPDYFGLSIYTDTKEKNKDGNGLLYNTVACSILIIKYQDVHLPICLCVCLYWIFSEQIRFSFEG